MLGISSYESLPKYPDNNNSKALLYFSYMFKYFCFANVAMWHTSVRDD